MLANRQKYFTPSSDKTCPPLSVAERDRRYLAIRAALREAGLQGLIVTESHLLYLSNGIWGETYGLLPTEEEEFEVILPWRYLVDLDPRVVIDSQDWVKRVSSGRDPSPLVARIKQLKLDGARLGFAGALSHQDFSFLMKALPSLELVNAEAILNNIRTIKSNDEIALIDRANQVFNAAIVRICEAARPGMLGREVIALGRAAMWEAGGDLASTFTLNFGARPAQNPLLADITLNSPIKDGDVATLTAHAHFHHYAGHSDQEIVFGTPKPRHVEMFEAVKKVRAGILKEVRPGLTNRELHDCYEACCSGSGFLTSEHSQMHQYGLDVPEFPGPAFKMADPRNKPLAGGGNFALTKGMVFSISPTLGDGESGELLLGGTSLVISDKGYRELGARPVELLVAG
ncbi:MAG TPA: M24 family metallopeptidase [Stellaceae bacterium]|jgi:Xaa-Pro aminopeptidase|nr:M24 family metallopeptidase [Stellaceae bacterium]